jgi:hypothetical protein
MKSAQIAKLNTLTKQTLAFAVSGLFLAVVSAAFAQITIDPEGTWVDPHNSYVFDAASGQPTDLNGSFIVIGDGSSIESWNFDVDGTHYTGGECISEDIISCNQYGFDGTCTIVDDGCTFTCSGDYGNDECCRCKKAPDQFSTLTMLFGALAAMAGVHHRLRLRSAAMPVLA